MSSAFLSIPEIGGKIPLSQTEVNHIGKREILNAATSKVAPSEFSTISSVKRDNLGEVIKEQFNIKYVPAVNSFVIEDRSSSNGTYLGSVNLKQTNSQKLSDGAEIILPLERGGKLVQLILIFHDGAASHPVRDKHQTVYPGLDQNEGPPASNAFEMPTIASKPFESASGGKYFDPTFEPTVAPTTSEGGDEFVEYPQNGAFDPSQFDLSDSSTSFILVRKKIDIPPDCFNPQVARDAGLDFSMVYKLEKSEFWHIMVAFIALYLMIYHTYVNILLISSLVYRVQSGFWLPANMVLITPLPTALMFCLAFLSHELGHLFTGRSLGYQSRFCLVSKGIKLTMIAMLIGVPIGLPGAAVSVGVDPQNDRDKMGAIKMAGPAVNLVFGVICILGSLFIPETTQFLTVLKTTLLQGAGLNFMLGVFNMIPKEFRGFAMDGKFIFGWKKGLYITLTSALLVGYVIMIIITSLNPV